jgi:hypothetical protein
MSRTVRRSRAFCHNKSTLVQDPGGAVAFISAGTLNFDCNTIANTASTAVRI